VSADIDKERAAFITAYRLWCYDSHPNAHPEMVQLMAESHWGRAAGAMWQARAAIPPAPTSAAAWAVEANIGTGVRAFVKFFTDEGDADRFAARHQAAYSGAERIKVPLCRLTPQSAPAMKGKSES
jgi:hypothetical protein